MPLQWDSIVSFGILRWKSEILQTVASSEGQKIVTHGPGWKQVFGLYQAIRGWSNHNRNKLLLLSLLSTNVSSKKNFYTDDPLWKKNPTNPNILIVFDLKKQRVRKLFANFWSGISNRLQVKWNETANFANSEMNSQVQISLKAKLTVFFHVIV